MLRNSRFAANAQRHVACDNLVASNLTPQRPAAITAVFPSEPPMELRHDRSRSGNLRRPRFLFQVFAAVLTLCTSANSYAVEPAASGQGKAAFPPLAKFPLSAEEAKRSQAEWAAALKVAPTIANSLNMKLTLIPPGRFSMGPNGSTYRVTINRPFYLGTTEVTLEAYRRFKPGHQIEGAAPEFNAGDRPAAMATWNDAVAFCRWLSEQPEERAAGRNYRLPSEARWEWAAGGNGDRSLLWR